MNTTRAQAMLDAIVGDWEPGWFDGVQPLLRAYCAQTAAARRLDRQIVETPVGTARWYALVEVSTRMTLELVDMAEALGLLPGGRHRPPAHLQ